MEVQNQEKIIVLSDLSTDRLGLVDYASTIVKEKPSKIILLYSYQVPDSTAGNVIELHDELKEKAKKTLEEDAIRIREIHGIDTEVVLSIGKTYNSVQRLLRMKNDVNWISGKSKNMDGFESYAKQNNPSSRFKYECNEEGAFIINLVSMSEDEIFDFLMILARFQDEI